MEEEPIAVQIEPTTRCSLNCPFCVGRTFPQGDISYQDFRKIISRFSKLACVSLQGEGEPLMHPDFIKMVKYLKERGAEVYTISNGLPLDIDMIKDLCNFGLDEIGISIESLNEKLYSKLKPGASLGKVISNVKKLIEYRNKIGKKNPRVHLRFIIMKCNISEIHRVVKLSKEIGLDAPFFSEIQDKPDYIKAYNRFIMSNLLSPDDKAAFKRVFTKYSFSNNNLFVKLSRISRKKSYCAFIENQLFINWKGFVSPCCFIKDPYMPFLGNLLEKRIDEIWNSNAYSGLRNSLKNGIIPYYCRGCREVKSI